jgi:hypothetical protein
LTNLLVVEAIAAPLYLFRTEARMGHAVYSPDAVLHLDCTTRESWLLLAECFGNLAKGN